MRRDDHSNRISRRAMLQATSLSGVAAQIRAGTASAEMRDYSMDASEISYGGARSDGARRRTVSEKLAERASLLDFDVDPSGRNDSTFGFRAAMEAVGAGELFVPPGRYLVGNLGLLGRAGRRIVGASRWESILLTERGGGPLFANEASASGSSAFHTLSDLMIDLNGEEITAIDLAGINASSIERIHFRGADGRSPRGVGVRFAAPIGKGAYDNVVRDCSFEFLRSAVKWAEGANNNAVFSCRINNCEIGFDIAPDGRVDTPRVFGGRVEACRIGLLEGAQQGCYYGIRFEGNSEADIAFTKGSENAGFWGGATAASEIAVRNVELAGSPRIDSSDLGQWAIEENTSRPKTSTGRHVFGPAGKAPPVHPARDYAAYFSNYVLLGQNASIEFADTSDGAVAESRIQGLGLNENGTLVVSAYSRKSQSYGAVEIGGGPSVHPIKDATTTLGTTNTGFKGVYLTDGVYVNGTRVVRSQAPAIPPHRSGSDLADKVNAVLGVLEYHGLIARQ